MKDTLLKIGLAIAAPLLLLTVIELVLWAFDVAPEGGKKGPKVGFDPEARHAQLDRTPDGPRIACFGGSSMAGMPLDYRLSMCTLSASALGREPEIIHDSGRGFDSQHIIERAEVTCRYPHQLVMIYSGHNEFINLHLFRRGVPTAAREASTWLAGFRFYRLIQSWVSDPESERPVRREDLGPASVTDEEVFARYEANLNHILELCKANPVVISTVVGNPAFTYPLDGYSTRESVAKFLQGHPPAAEVRYRARPRINQIIRKVAAERGVPLVDAEAIIAGRDATSLFWDGVHPRPQLHLELASAFLETAKKAGLIAHYTPPRLSIDPAEVQREGENAAFEAMGLDPRFVLRVLSENERPVNLFGVHLGRAIAGFLAHDDKTMHAGLSAAAQLLAQPGYRPVFAACVGMGGGGPQQEQRRERCGLRCLPFPCGAEFMKPEERSELLRIAQTYRDPVLYRLLELF